MEVVTPAPPSRRRRVRVARGKGPTVRELAADLGLPDDFGHEHLVDHLQQGVAAGQVAHDQGRFTLTGAGRLALAADVAPRPAPLEPSLLP